MRAMQLRAYGGPDLLELVERDAPTPGEGQLAIRVVCASVNPIDWKRASGAYRLIMPVSFPMVPGYDVAGEVIAVGPGAAGLSVGDRVHARIKEMSGGGCAEVAIAGLDVTTRMPDAMSYAEAAALPLAGMTALQGLRDGAGLSLTAAAEPAPRVLVVGASGGVGHFATQLARAMGTHVVGVSSTRNLELVRALGAHETIDYTSSDPYAGQPPFDVVLDCVGGEPGKYLPRMTSKGRYLSCVPGPAVFARGALNLVCRKRVSAVLLRPRAVDLRALDELWSAGRLRVVVEGRFPLADLAEAWRRSIAGRTVGKIVIDVGAG